MAHLDIVTDMNTNEIHRSQVDCVLGEPRVRLLDILNEVYYLLSIEIFLTYQDIPDRHRQVTTTTVLTVANFYKN